MTTTTARAEIREYYETRAAPKWTIVVMEHSNPVRAVGAFETDQQASTYAMKLFAGFKIVPITSPLSEAQILYDSIINHPGVFTPRVFVTSHPYASRDNVDQVLSRLTKAGLVQRVRRGVYKVDKEATTQP